MRMNPGRLFILFALLLCGCQPPDQDIPFSVARLFSDGAMLQRDALVPVWGTAPSGARVTITLDDAHQEVEAASDGSWRGALEPQEAGGPHALTLSAGDLTLEIGDVWFGDVWIASGQSNMEWTVAAAADAEHEIRSASDPMIRHFRVPRSWAYAPASTLESGAWHQADSAHVGAFTAVGYFFARALRDAVDVPIGILNTSWGGSRIEAWMDADAMVMDPDTLASVLALNEQRHDNLRRTFKQEHHGSETEDPGVQDGVAVWADPDLDTSDWADIIAPMNWEAAGFPGLDGSAWYRATVTLSEEQLGAGEATLYLGRIDDNEMTWVNGALVGQTTGWTIPRVYSIAPGVLASGDNTIAVQVQDGAGNGGMLGGEDILRLETSAATIPLDSTWKFHIGQFVLRPDGNANQLPTLLYNKMIRPIESFPVSDCTKKAYWEQFAVRLGVGGRLVAAVRGVR